MDSLEFKAYPKIARLSRDVIVTEKIDGTNGQIFITEIKADETIYLPVLEMIGNLAIVAGSRNHWLGLGKADNFGFAAWVKENARELVKLGPGRFFGEWWGQGIQRGYGLTEKRFSLFRLPKGGIMPICCNVVPTVWEGPMDTNLIEFALASLKQRGSLAAPGYMFPEGIVVFHSAAGVLFKKTIADDAKPKGLIDGFEP